MSPEHTSKVFLTESSDRDAAVRNLFASVVSIDAAQDVSGIPGAGVSPTGLAHLSGKSVVLKANFNSADPFPASTHLDTLRALIAVLKETGVGQITLAERSGMGDTRENLEKLGLFALSGELGFKVVVLDEEPKGRWARIERGETHWLRGFYLSKEVLEAEVVIQTCCLKTHKFGGHFTMSLKNSVGLVAKKLPGGLYDYMWELHGSPYQRLMVAEINRFYAMDLVIMDAAKAFIDGGPDKGTEVEPGLMLAGTDRVALDAVGVAILREFGATSLMKKPIFEMGQIRRAAELGVGVSSASAIELVSLDERSAEAAERIVAALRRRSE